MKVTSKTHREAAEARRFKKAAKAARAAKATHPETRNREWGFFGTMTSGAPRRSAEAAWDKAMTALTDPKGAFRLSPNDARDLLDATWGRHFADQLVDRPIAAGIAALAQQGWARSARHFVREHINPALEPETKTTKEQTIERIAREALGLETLEERRSDSLDFHDLHVARIADALRAAFEAGRASRR